MTTTLKERLMEELRRKIENLKIDNITAEMTILRSAENTYGYNEAIEEVLSLLQSNNEK